jgi:hypothetical protein
MDNGFARASEDSGLRLNERVQLWRTESSLDEASRDPPLPFSRSGPYHKARTRREHRNQIMGTTKRRLGKAEFAERGDAIYEQEIRPKLRAADQGKFVAIDIDTHDYEIDPDQLTACDRLRERVPNAQIWMVRIGSRSVHRFGGGRKRGTS